MNKTAPLSLAEAFQTLVFEPSRSPESEDIAHAFCELSQYRDGAIYLGHWAGRSEWEKHSEGDEIVMVIEGETTLSLLHNGEEVPNTLKAGQILVVPQNTWHRFETPSEVKVLTVTPQPTLHSVERPE